ncbi:MAG TPA: gamma-glutamyltransferase, partial [Cyanobacteria bacterium UBA11166]|nr:gamma-glutamyltransferase [Cyanobacteria bacterium UBA11166]
MSKLALNYLLALTLSATLLHPITALTQSPAPEASSGRIERKALQTQTDMVVAANPLAAATGRDILHRGGSAVDA